MLDIVAVDRVTGVYCPWEDIAIEYGTGSGNAHDTGISGMNGA